MEEEFSNHSNNESFEEVLNSYMSRRQMIVGGLAGAALSFMGGSKVSALTSNAPQVAAAAKKAKIGFTSIPLQLGAMPTIAPEYDYSVLIPWREKLDGSGKSFDYAGFTAEDQAKSIGIGHDGICYFGDNKKGMLCINHEYGTTPHIMGKAVPASLDDVKLSQTAHGVSVVMIENTKTGWKMVKSTNNRRIHGNTAVKFSGPAAKSDMLVNPAGNPMQGTLNNCANGETPWGTYLTCEENFNGYFGTNDKAWKPNTDQARYGLSAAGFGYEWHKFDARFDLSNAGYVNEINRFGWVVEIDPNNPKQVPVKRTALGRIKHEGATVVEGTKVTLPSTTGANVSAIIDANNTVKVDVTIPNNELEVSELIKEFYKLDSPTEIVGTNSKNYIGNKKISKDEQLYIRSQNPGKSVSWYKSYERNLRKERTIRFINTIYDRTITDNDVADACGIGHWSIKNWGKAIGVDK